MQKIIKISQHLTKLQ